MKTTSERDEEIRQRTLSQLRAAGLGGRPVGRQDRVIRATLREPGAAGVVIQATTRAPDVRSAVVGARAAQRDRVQADGAAAERAFGEAVEDKVKAAVSDQERRYGLTAAASPLEVQKSLRARNALIRAGHVPGLFRSAGVRHRPSGPGSGRYRGFPRAVVAEAVGLTVAASDAQLDAACLEGECVAAAARRPRVAAAGSSSGKVVHHADGGATYRGQPVRFAADGSPRVFTFDGWVTTGTFDAQGDGAGTAATAARRIAQGAGQNGPTGDMFRAGL